MRVIGIFDVFTGKPGREAAARNRALYDSLETRGMQTIDRGFARSEDAMREAELPYQRLSDRYTPATELYLDAIGARGAEGLSRARAAFQTSPGYQFALDQAVDANDRRAAARGMLGSGNTVAETTRLATGLADQQWGNFLERLGGFVQPEMEIARGQSGVRTARAGLYGEDADCRLGLMNTVTGGHAGANNLEAQSKMSGSGNLWNFGLDVARIASGWGKPRGSR